MECLISYSAIAIEFNQFYSIEKDLYNILLDNGSILMVYGKNLPMEEIESYLGEVKVTNEELPVADIELSGYPKDVEEPLSNGLQDDVILLYAYKMNGEINFGGVIDGSNEKLYSATTGKWIKSKDIDVLDENGKVIKEGRELEVDDVLKDINSFINGIKDHGQRIIDVQTDENSGKVNTMMYPVQSNTIVKADFWTYFTQGKSKTLVYATRVINGSTCYWDLATCMNVVPNSGYGIYYFRTKTSVNYTYEDISDWTQLPSNDSSISITLGASPLVSYTTSTSSLIMRTSVLTKAIEWEAAVTNYMIDFGNKKIEPALRASNSSGDFWFKRYYQDVFHNVLNYYYTSYYSSSYDMDMQ